MTYGPFAGLPLGHPATLPTDAKLVTGAEYPWQCVRCPAVYLDPQGVADHVEEVHRGEVLEAHCSYCGADVLVDPETYRLAVHQVSDDFRGLSQRCEGDNVVRRPCCQVMGVRWPARCVGWTRLPHQHGCRGKKRKITYAPLHELGFLGELLFLEQGPPSPLSFQPSARS